MTFFQGGDKVGLTTGAGSSWSAAEVRNLRYRLGWCQAEMARNLNLDLHALASIEMGLQEVPSDLLSHLAQINRQASSSAERLQREPMAEAMMRDRGLSQIHDFDVASELNS